MNFVKKLVGRRLTLDDSSPLSGDEGLSLMHLRKLFMEFIHSSVPLTLREQEKKLYAMLPLFIKVFSNAKEREMTERFGDTLQFAAHTSRLMVNEIRRHAVNKSNDNASASIMNFLIMRPEDQTQSGWNLLKSLSVLASGEKAIVECMIASQLPSTLVHCLYLFFELPAVTQSGTLDNNIVQESHSTVQKLFIELLVRLCNQEITAQELVKTDDLFILFTAMTCKCKPYNIGWRDGICEVLKCITRHGLRQDVCNYIHAKSCVSHCISSMQQIQATNPVELVEMFITLFSILKDSTAISSVLMDDFRSCQGYLFLCNYLSQLGEMEDEAGVEACRSMVICVSGFAMVGYTPLRPPKSIGAPFQEAEFKIPEATENGNTVRNIEAFHVLQTVFVKSEDNLLCQQILDCILRIYTSDQVNYFILEPQRTLSIFIEKANEKNLVVQEKIFKLLEYVGCSLNWTPSPELISLSILFKNSSVNSSWICALECLIQLLNHKDKYKDVFRDVGLLEVLTNCLKYYCVGLKKLHNDYGHMTHYKPLDGFTIDPALVPDETQLNKYTDYPMLLMECFRIMLEKCPKNADMFRACGGSRCLHNIVLFQSARGEALKIIQELILNGAKDDLGTLLNLLHSGQDSVIHMKIEILRTIIKVFALDPITRALFRDVGGFIYVMSVLMRMEGALDNEHNSGWKHIERSHVLELFRTVFYVLTSAMQDEPANKTFFMDEVRYKGLADSLRFLGCFDAHATSLPAGSSPISPANLRTRLDRTISTRSSIYIDPRVPKFHPGSSLFAALHVFHCLLDMAMDSFTLKVDSPCNDETDHGRVYPLDVSYIYHPGAITVLVELLPSICESKLDEELHGDGTYQDALDLQLYVANRVQACLRSERNQQVMCQAGLPQQILLHCEAALISESHPLHPPLQRIFERLATQALTPVVLRDFMRLGHPLHCSAVEIHKESCQEEAEDVVDSGDKEKEKTPLKNNILPKLNDPPYSSSPLNLSDIHKDSLKKDFTETRIASGNYFIRTRSRTSSTNSSCSGDELLTGEESTVGSPTDSQGHRKPKKCRSNSTFYTLSPSSSYNSEVDGRQMSREESVEDPSGSDDVPTDAEALVESSSVVVSPTSPGSDFFPNEHDAIGEASLKRQGRVFEDPSGSNVPTIVAPPTLSDSDALPNHPDSVGGASSIASNQISASSLSGKMTSVPPEDDESCSEIASRRGGGPIPLSRIKCLVSMTTPRDMHLCGTTSLPGFVEFNMTSDGFGCLYFPSISPHVPQEAALVGSMAGVSAAVIGAVQGIGAGERAFPPQAGVTFVAWICVERFSSQYDDAHPIRLLTICSKTKQSNGSIHDNTCFTVRISGMDKSLVVGTEEELVKSSPVKKKSKTKNEVRFPLQDVIQEGYWHHIIVTLKCRPLIAKQSIASVYFDGALIGTGKLRYIQVSTVGNLSFAVSSIDAYIGTRRTLRRCSRLIWQLGPCHFLEEPLQSAEAAVMYQLGPSYLGSFQSPFVNKNNHSGEREIRDPVVAEANIVFGLHAHATSLLTIAKLKKHFSKAETRAVAKELGLSKRDSTTPVRLVYNTVSHLQGPSRCRGGVIVGISGVRTFFPRPVAELISCVGGTTTLLGLVAMANDVEMLYASVKALSCVLRHSFSARQDMERIKGYQILALLFKRKSHLLNTHILHLTFALVGTVDSEREMSVIPNHMAFKDLLCDFEVWTRAPDNLQRSLVAHFLELLIQSSQLSMNVELMQNLAVVPKLLYVLKDETTTISSIKIICEVLTVLLKHGTDKRNLLRFGQFLMWTITSPDQSERQADVTKIENSMSYTDGKIESSEQRMGKRIILRNRLLEILLILVGGGTEDGLDERFSLDIQEVLGFDWIMLFLKETLNCSTVVRALRLLVIILSDSSALERFREGSCNGGWLTGTETLSSKLHVVGAFNVKPAISDDGSCEVNKDVVNVPGFATLNQLLSKHVEVPEIYHLVISLLLRHPVADVDAGKMFDWDSLYHVFWVATPSASGSNSSPPPSPRGPEKHTICCAEAASALLSMARNVCSKDWEESDPGSWLQEYPVIVVQFLRFLYQNVEQFSAVSSSQDFVEHLVSVVFPEGKQLRIVSTDGSALQILNRYSRRTIIYCNDEKEMLIRHPAKRLVMEFIRVLITDALTTPPFLKAVQLVDMILESFPSTSKHHQVVEFQTEVLQSQMEYLLAGNLLLNPGKAMPCIFSFTSRIVDKLWQDHFNLGYKPIFNFIVSLLNAVKGRSKDGAFFSMNRVILYQLSRQLKELTDFTEMLDFLHLLTANYRIVFSSMNNDSDFIASLCYWLLIMTGASLPEVTGNINGQNHEGHETSPTSPGPQDLSHSSTLLTAAAERVWEVFIQNKREVIEAVFKTRLPQSNFTAYGPRETVDIPKNFKTMNLDPKSLGSTLLEPAKKMWDSFYISQIKHHVESPKPQHKLAKKPTMVRLPGRQTKKDKGMVDTSLISNSDMWTVQHMDLVRRLFQHQHRNYFQNYKLIERSCSQEWSLREDDLTRVRGLWGPPSDSRLDKWMLDMVEGPCRMRKKMCQNDMFYDHYNFVESGKKLKKFKIPMSFDSKLYSMLTNQKISALENKMEKKDERAIHDMQASCTAESDELEANENNDVDDQTIVKLLEAGEKIRTMFRCARVEGLDHAEGLFLYGQFHFYVVDGITLLSNNEIKEIDSIPPEAHDPIVPKTSHNSPRSFKKVCSTWAYEAVREVHKRRYLLQETALEVFSSDGRNHFLVFPKSVRDKVYNKMLSLIPNLTASPTESVVGMKADTDVESGVGLINSIMGERSVTQRWERGEISNFQYLMHLNTLSGRSYNDLMQYPVYPWIIADYESEELDLVNPATFRDLSKPMGAQTEPRRKAFEKRYKEWDDPNGETPPCHYPTHYSSASVVASYLVRMEPFAQHFLRLNDGHFDLADRMFHSVKGAWLSASQTNMADIKELIPEFFYLPEFLLNENRFDLGHKQSGVVLGDVILPTWAKGDAREFIRLHRKALECDYVSSRLHEWIDLIFGCKQRNAAALNVFHHWYYEDSADISNNQDPLRRNATIGFIDNFGQIPKQLFKRPHVTKKVFVGKDLEQPGASSVVNADRFFVNLTKLVPSTQPVKEIKGPVGQIVQSDKGILVVRKNHALFPPPCNQYVAWGFGDLSLRIGQLESDKIIAVMEDFQVGQVLCAACPDARTLITGGTNTLVYVWMVTRENVRDKRPQLVIHEVLYGHLQPVTCLAVSSSYNLIVSGSEDMTCIIWDLNKLTYVRQLPGHVSTISGIAINDLTGDIVTCAGTHLYLWSVNGQLIVETDTSLRPSNPIHCCIMSELTEWDEDVILTGDQDGVVKMWSVEYYDENSKSSVLSPTLSNHEEPDLTANASREDMEPKESEDIKVTEPVDAQLNHLVVQDQDYICRSLPGEYVMIDSNTENTDSSEQTKPLACWKRRLVMRSQLTMHTAFSREDNRLPAAVTAILISKDHKKLFVGDARGRVYSWSVSDAAGRIANHWVKDDSSGHCTACNTKFSMRERKHHCRDCGKLYCSKCSDFESKISRLAIGTPVRVCFACYDKNKLNTKLKR